MASHHCLCHHPTTASYCHYCSPYSSCHHHPPPPPPPDCHPVYHAPPQPRPYSAQTRLPNLQQYNPHFQEPYFQEERETQHTVSSLLRRIAALEAALRRRSSTSSSSAFHSLRDAAARTIQTHFRAFLLRRSRTLRQLKGLASIKSRLGLLKSSLSEKTHLDFDVIYHEAVTLLLKVDTIQGGDPMIRDGKRSVTRELNNFLDFLDGFCVERRGLSTGVNARIGRNNVKHGVGNNERKSVTMNYGGPRTGSMDKLRGLAERIDKLAEELDDEENEVIESPHVLVKKKDVSGSKNRGLLKNLSGVQPKVKKSVTFADNGKVFRVLRRNHIDENDNDNEDDLCREVEVIRVSPKQAEEEEEEEDDDEVEARSENGGSLCSSDGERELRKMHDKGEADNFTFDAPLPLKMETRADLIDRRMKLAN